MPLHPEYEAMLAQMAEVEGPTLVDMPVEAGREMYRTMQPEALDVPVAAVTDASANGVPGAHLHAAGRGAVSARDDVPRRRLGDRRSRDGRRPKPRSVQRRWRDGGFGGLSAGAGTSLPGSGGRLLCGHRLGRAERSPHRCRLQVASPWPATGAGGNLAAVVSQMARDKRHAGSADAPNICFQLLVYPVTDGVNFNTASYRDNGEGYMLTADSMHWFWDHYAPEPADRSNPYASPLLAEDLTDLPEALVMTAEYDPLRDEGEAYAMALANAGVTARCQRYGGMIHGFFGQSRVVSAARAPMDDACKALRTALAA